MPERWQPKMKWTRVMGAEGATLGHPRYPASALGASPGSVNVRNREGLAGDRAPAKGTSVRGSPGLTRVDWLLVNTGKAKGVVRAGVLLLCVLASCQDPGPAPRATELWTAVGRVFDEHGEPLGDAGVLVASSGLTTHRALANPTVRTGKDGRFEVQVTAYDPTSGEPNQRILIAAPGLSAVVWEREAFEWDEDNQVSYLGDVVLLPGFDLRGEVRDEDGDPVVGANVTARDVMPAPGFAREAHSRFDFVSVAETDERGAFELPGVVAPAGFLSVSADGFYFSPEEFVTPTSRPLVQLRRGGFAEGIVSLPGGQAAAADLYVEYASGATLAEGLAGSDGAFRINLQYPGSYRIAATILDGDAEGESVITDVLAGPASGIALDFAGGSAPTAPPTGGKGVTVRVVDGETGASVERCKASIVWADSGIGGDPQLLAFFAASRARWFRSGELVLPEPEEGEPRNGIVVVEAAGYAPFRKYDVSWDPADPPVVDVVLHRELVLTGVVVDEDTGEPVPGVQIFCEQTPVDAWFSDEDGRFRITGLVEGEHTVCAVREMQMISEQVAVELRRDQAMDDVELVLPRGASLEGVVVGADPGVGWQVRIVGVSGPGELLAQPHAAGGPQNQRAFVGPDGDFTVTGLSEGHYVMQLLLPQGHHRGPSLAIPIDSFEVGATGLRREFDVSGHLPGVIQGYVHLEGALPSAQRLVVVANRDSGEESMSFVNWKDYDTYAPVAADGSYRMEAVAGEHRLQILDLATGIPLAKPRPRTLVRSGRASRRDLDLGLAEVRVEIKPESEERTMPYERLEVLVDHPIDRNPRGGVPFGGNGSDSGAGASLVSGAREFTFYLPECPIKLRVHRPDNRFEMLRPWESAPYELPLAWDVTPVLGEVTRVELPVPN